MFLFPAAAATNTPAYTMAAAALLTATDVSPPRDRLATVPLGRLRVCESVVTKFMPSMRSELRLLRQLPAASLGCESV